MRRISVALAIVLAPFFTFAAAAADTSAAPNFSGEWRLDATKSQETGGAIITLAIKQDSDTIHYDRAVRDGNGRHEEMKFTCAVGGSQCDFDEAGHKAKVSLWYDGSALVILKTDGRREDETTERRLQLSPDGSTLTVQFTNLAGNDKPEKLVFTKEGATVAATH